MSAGSHFSAALNSDGNVFTWGSNFYDQLGIDTDQLNVPTPTMVPDINDVVSIISGGFTMMFLTIQREFYVWGIKYGLVKYTKNEWNNDTPYTPYKPQKIKLDFNIKSIVCGLTHYLFISENDEVYVTGTNEFGQLGTDDRTKKIFHKLTDKDFF